MRFDFVFMFALNFNKCQLETKVCLWKNVLEKVWKFKLSGSVFHRQTFVFDNVSKNDMITMYQFSQKRIG